MLADRYEPSTLAKNVIPFDEYCPYPRVDDRESWDSLPAEVRKSAIERGEELLDFEWPVLTAVRFMDFRRDGNRSRYEALYFRRRSALGGLVLAECLEGKGRFIDQIINGIWCICEESTWILPAHNPAKGPLPDAFVPSVDLFAADTGALLSWVHYLVGSQLDVVSPLVAERIRREVNHRILTPFMTEDMHWMGFGHSVNNWNPWCTSNCLASMLLMEKDSEQRVAAAERSLRILDNWLKDYAPDGGCDEGPSYWNVAGGALFDCLELLLGATGGCIDFYDEPLIAEIGRYIMRVHISGGYFVNFADAGTRLDVDGCMIYRYGRRIADEELTAMGASAFRTSKGVLMGGRWFSFNRVLPEVFICEGLSKSDAQPPYLRDVYMDGIQVMAAREQAGTESGLYLAAKGGHNSESHNHNDIGSFIVYANGRPMLIDAGVGSYTAATFSANRYSIWTMQSGYHNLPTVNGQMQQAGGQFAASDVSYHYDDALAQLSLNIAGAYPREAGIEKWQRTCRLHRGNEGLVEIVDDFALGEASDVTMNLLTAWKPEVGGGLIVRDADGVGVQVEFESGVLMAEVEAMEIDDGKLSAVWGPRIYRVLLRSKESVSRGTWRMAVRML
jgi:hypothetical protein